MKLIKNIGFNIVCLLMVLVLVILGDYEEDEV